jgi:hypothetical protein
MKANDLGWTIFNLCGVIKCPDLFPGFVGAAFVGVELTEV